MKNLVTSRFHAQGEPSARQPARMMLDGMAKNSLSGMLRLATAIICVLLLSTPRLSAQSTNPENKPEAVKKTDAPSPKVTPAASGSKDGVKEAEPKKAEAKPLETAAEQAQSDSKWTPFQLALFHPVQIFPWQYSVKGFNWNFLYSKNSKIYGFDLSPTGATQSSIFGGMQFAAVGLSKEMNGFQLALFGDFSRVARGMQICAMDLSFSEVKSFSGFKIVGVGPYSEMRNLNGAVISPFISFTETMSGFQLGLAHCEAKRANGVQLGSGYNLADEFNGLQLGLFNESKRMSGAQLGILNVCHDNWLPVSFIINLGF